MNWIDITTYSKEDIRRNPTILECRLSNEITFKVHKHIYYGDMWLLTSMYAGFAKEELGTDDLETAKKTAVEIMLKILSDKESELKSAINELSK